MASFDPYTWYVLRNGAQTINNTLTASNNTQTAFDPNSPSAIYYAPGSGTIPLYQQWQLFPVNSSATASSAFVLRNRLIGPDAYLTTAWTTRKCGGGACATVPVLSPTLSNSSLWNFASWGWSDVTGGAYIYNLGNDSTWRLDVMDGGLSPELVNFDDTGRLAQHWFVSAYASFAASETSSFRQVPTTATALLAQFTGEGATGSITPYTIATVTATTTASGSMSTGQAVTSSAGNNTQSSSNSHSGGLSTGAAIGIGVGIGVAVLLVIGLLTGLFCYRRRKSRRTDTLSKSTTPIQRNQGINGTTSAVTSLEVEGEDKKYYEMASPIEGSTLVGRAEMTHPSTRSVIRHELDGKGGGLGKPPVEMEHPSTRM